MTQFDKDLIVVHNDIIRLQRWVRDAENGLFMTPDEFWDHIRVITSEMNMLATYRRYHEKEHPYTGWDEPDFLDEYEAEEAFYVEADDGA